MSKLFGERVVEICDSLTEEDWHNELSDKMIKARKDIHASSREEIPKLLNAYDDLCQEMNCKTIDRIYAKAFKDAILIMKF